MRGAAAAARALGHEYLGTEHLLLGLIRTSPDILQGRYEPADLVAAVERRLPPGREDGVWEWKELPYTAGGRKVLELAMKAARKTGLREVRPEHMIRALILEGKGVAAVALEEVGIDSPDNWTD